MFRATAVRVKDAGTGIRADCIYLLSVEAGAVPKRGWTMQEDVARDRYQLQVAIDEGKAVDTETMRIVSVSPDDERYTLVTGEGA